LALHLAIFGASILDSDVTPSPPGTELAALYFDGHSAQAHAAMLRVHHSSLLVHLGAATLEVPLSRVKWSERTRHGRRSAHLPDHAVLQCDDPMAWDAWRQAHGIADPAIVVIQQSWTWVTVFAIGLVLLIAAAYQWGLPALAKGVVAITPYSMDEKFGTLVLDAMEEEWLQASEIPLAKQEAIRLAFAQALAAQKSTELPPWRLEFRKWKRGPNAFALPGDTMVLTDDMVDLVEGDTRVLVAILGHELGHLHHRHGMRGLVEVSAIGVVASLLWGDFSWVLTTVPTWLAKADYSRSAEREADAYALDVLNAAGISPTAMVTLFDKLEARREAELKKGRTKDKKSGAKDQKSGAGDWLSIAFSSHPADAERIAFFQGGVRK
jgi:Zn-dependent protease with chaperone function